MPVNKIQQARIEFSSKAQIVEVGALLTGNKFHTRMSIEECNLEDGKAIAVISPRGCTVVFTNGDTHAVGGKGA